MKKFWGFYDNGIYRVGCNGATIYIYDQTDKELYKFKDIKDAYEGTFHPSRNMFVAKSTEGSLAVYDLDRKELVRKIVITRIGGQDDGYAFSPDGTLFYNIERPVRTIRTQLTVYRTSDFEVVSTYFSEDEISVLKHIEFDANTGECYLSGFMRSAKGIFDYGFIGKLSNGSLSDIKKLTRPEHDYVNNYKKWGLSGYTENA